jgi:glycosyl transferase family 25
MDAYVINLDKRTDRWEQLQKDWADYPEINLIRVSGIEHTKGFIGCARSHLKVVQYAKDNKMPFILVMEDDAKPTRDFKKLWKRCLRYIDNHQDEWDIFNGGTSIVSLSRGTAEKLTSIMFKTSHAYGLHFVIYSEKCYDKILSWEDSPGILEERPPIDVFYTNFYLNLVTYAVFPYLAVQGKGKSDILNKYVDYTDSFRYTAIKLKKIMNS